MIEILRCPVSGGKLQLDAAQQRLLSVEAALAYPIRDGIIVLLEEEATPYNAQAADHL